MQPARVIVVGGSLGGLLVANMLHRAGVQVQLLERAPGSLDGRGAGIVTHSGLMTALRMAGVVVDEALGVRVTTRVALDERGAEVARTHHEQMLTSWSRLYVLLRNALPGSCYASGCDVVNVSQDSNGVQVFCADGAVVTADMLIASDGVRSSVRSQFAPEVTAPYAGYVGWRGVADEAMLSENTRNTLFEHFGFGLPAGEQIIGYPVAGAGNSTRIGERRYNFVWYRAADDRELQALLTDEQGQHHRSGIAPNRVALAQVARMQNAARQLLAPQWVDVIAKTAMPFLQPIHDLMSERISFGRVALMGDAAFVARPHVGMGVTKAGDDAMALTRAIAQHGATAAACLAYERERLLPGQAVVERGRRLGAYMQAQGKAQGKAQGQAPADLPSTLTITSIVKSPERTALSVLRETAVDLALAA